MAYSTHNFSSGDTLYASQLNEMDNQIALNEQDIAELKSSGGGESIPEFDKYKLLKTIEIGGATDVGLITVDKDESGNAFSIRHLIIYAVMPTARPTCSGRILINDIGAETAFFSPFFSDGTQRLYVRMDVMGDGLLLIAERTGGQNANMWTAVEPEYSNHLPSDLGVETIPDITKIRIYLNDGGKWAADATLYFYGY